MWFGRPEFEVHIMHIQVEMMTRYQRWDYKHQGGSAGKKYEIDCCT